MMIKRRNHPLRLSVIAAWTLIWFGTIMAVDGRGSLSRIGALLWGAGMTIQLVIVARWLIGRAGGGPFTSGPAAG
jgi:hypothetical protein